MHLYLEGLSFRSTGRFSGVSNISVLNWVRSFGKEVQELNSESQETEMVEVDEKKYIASDYRKVYESIIPEEKHIQTKAKTYTVEGYNSLFRNFLARMRRKAKSYSKKPDMLKLSIV